MTRAGAGVLAVVGSSTIWGVSGVYFSLLNHLPPLEILFHRTFWSLVFFVCFLGLQRRVHELTAVLADRRLLAIMVFSATMVGANWLLFIIAIQTGHATQASLGYYVFPLIAAGLGAVFLGERFSRAKVVALALATIAVLVLTVSLGTFPWIAAVLALTFSVYGLVKKRLSIGPVVSVTVEVALVAPFLLGWVLWNSGGLGAVTANVATAGLLIGLVFFTGVPLALFAFASRRLDYATLGLIQYLNPSLQFAVAALILQEQVTTAHMIAFPLIWLGLAIYSGEALLRERASRRAARAAAGSATGVM